MRVKIIQNSELEEDKVTIECKIHDDMIDKLAMMIENYGANIVGKLDSERYIISLQDVFYFEAVDNHVFAYTNKDVYEVSYKIQELCDKFIDTSFLQVSRTIILNIDKIAKVSTMVNGKVLAILNNKEKIIITRAYATNFKEKIRRENKI